MRLSLIIILVFSAFELFASSDDHGERDFEDRLAPYWIESEVEDQSLQDEMSRVTLASSAISNKDAAAILYGYNGNSFVREINENPIDFILPSGKYVFQFYIESELDYVEITTDSIEVKSGFNMTIQLNFFIATSYPNSVRKPVIYLYPEEKTDISVKVIPKGEMTFTYPTYDDGWKCTAEPNGDLAVDGKQYNYLFWESEQDFGKSIVDETAGFIVTGSEVTEFLDKKLNSIGFTGKERADFVTFWAPMMVEHDELFVHFKVNEECKVFADLEIIPTPDEIARLYILWSPLPVDFNRNSLKEQNLPSINREGFTVVEWGGAEIDLVLLNSN